MSKARTHPIPECVLVCFDQDSGRLIVQSREGARAFDPHSEEHMASMVRLLKQLAPTRLDAAEIVAAAKTFNPAHWAVPAQPPHKVARFLNPAAARGAKLPKRKPASIEDLYSKLLVAMVEPPTSDGEVTH